MAGAVVAAYIVDRIYYTIYISEFVHDTDWLALARYAIFVTGFVVFLYSAARGTHTVEGEMLAWLRKRGHGLSGHQLVIMLDEIRNHRISLKAGGMVPITYGFIGTVSQHGACIFECGKF
jgi:hypothetical protein